MDDARLPTHPTPTGIVAPKSDTYPGSLADDVAVGVCAGLGAMALVSAGTAFLLRAGIVPYSPLIPLYFRGGALVLLGAGVVAAVMAETPFSRRLFAFSSILTLAFIGLKAIGLGHVPLQVGFGLAMLGGAVVWMRRPAEESAPALDGPWPSGLLGGHETGSAGALPPGPPAEGR